MMIEFKESEMLVRQDNSLDVLLATASTLSRMVFVPYNGENGVAADISIVK